MFDIDSGKLLIIGIVALVVIGPKELPGVLRQVGNALGKVRRMAAEFQGQFMEAMRESELEELKKDVQKMSDSANFTNFDPLADVKNQFNEVGSSLETTLAAPVAPVETAELASPDALPAATAESAAAEAAPTPISAPDPDPAPTKTGGTA
jgi:sec-independent protein translocase protein TatB